MTDIHAKIKVQLQQAEKILIVTHIRPDGDAVGSMLALGLALQAAGKQVKMVLPDGLPDSFRHLPGSEGIRDRIEGNDDLAISVDCSDLGRTGNILGSKQPGLVIDHHVTNTRFGIINLVEADAAATTSILMRHMHRWGLVITPPVGANLLTGLITDTLGFRTTSTTAETLRQAAELLELGVDMSELYFNGLVRRTLAGARYWGAGLSSLECVDGILSATLTQADRQAAGYPGNDDADLINIVSSIDGATIAVMFVEQSPTSTKVSWRSLKPGIDVAKIAAHFGGGGHTAAAGAEIEGSLAQVRARVLDATHSSMEGKIEVEYS